MIFQLFPDRLCVERHYDLVVLDRVAAYGGYEVNLVSPSCHIRCKHNTIVTIGWIFRGYLCRDLFVLNSF